MEIDFTPIGETAARAMEMIERECSTEKNVVIQQVGIVIIVEYEKEGETEPGYETFTRFTSPLRYVQFGVVKEMSLSVLDGEGIDEEEEEHGTNES